MSTLTYAPLTAKQPADAAVIWRLREPQTGTVFTCRAWFTPRGRARWRLDADGQPIAGHLAHGISSLQTLLIVGDGFRADGWQEVLR
jgi:hypothetical protein